MNSTLPSVSERTRRLIFADEEETTRPPENRSNGRWRRLFDTGTALWLSTVHAEQAELLWCREFGAFTTRMAWLRDELESGPYDRLFERVAAELSGDLADRDLVREICFAINARHGLELANRFGAAIALGVHPDLADDLEGMLGQARRYSEIAPEAFIVQMPFTASGLLAAHRLRAERVRVHMTSAFSARQNHLAARFADPHFVSTSIGRIDAFAEGNGFWPEHGGAGERAAMASDLEMKRLRADHGARTRQVALDLQSPHALPWLAGVDVLALHPETARAYEALREEEAAPAARTRPLPEIPQGGKSDRKALRADSLWEIKPTWKQAVDELIAADQSHLRPEDLHAHFAARPPYEGVLPRWTESDRAAAREDGAVPNYARWREMLQDGRIEIDALLNLCDLEERAAEQAGMDERIRSML